MTTPGDGSGDDGNSGNSGNDGYDRNGWGGAGRDGGFPSFGSYSQGDGNQPPLYGAGAAPAPPVNTGTNRDQLFSSLFDFGFTRYATPSIVKIAYALGVIALGLAWLVAIITVLFGMAVGDAGAGDFILGLVGLVLLTVWMVFLLMLLRMGPENFLSNVRIAQATQAMDYRQAVEQQRR